MKKLVHETGEVPLSGNFKGERSNIFLILFFITLSFKPPLTLFSYTPMTIISLPSTLPLNPSLSSLPPALQSSSFFPSISQPCSPLHSLISSTVLPLFLIHPSYYFFLYHPPPFFYKPLPCSTNFYANLFPLIFTCTPLPSSLPFLPFIILLTIPPKNVNLFFSYLPLHKFPSSFQHFCHQTFSICRTLQFSP